MFIPRAFALTLIMGMAAAAPARGFDAGEYFGDAFRADEERAQAGVLSNPLTGDQPHWIEFSGSGEDLAVDRFTLTETGLYVRPNREHGTCEGVLDVGLSRGTARVKVVELVRGGAIAWHLRDLKSSEAWLVELMHQRNGGWQLRIRVRANGRYSVVPDSRRNFEKLDLPADLTVHIEKDKLTAEIADHKTETDATLINGVGLGLAVTDQPARLRALHLDIELHPAWVADADTRLRARHALSRLREFATVGLLAGLADYGHPGAEEALKQYSEKQTAARRAALEGDIYNRAVALVEIANAHPQLAPAQHEAGVAALLAGDVDAARDLLSKAAGIKRENVTSLALAEAYRRGKDLKAAEKSLRRAEDGLPADLRPDFALIQGRLSADRGDIESAKRTLRAASRHFPEHEQIAAFADSAEVLFNPGMLRQSGIVGPLGLTLMTDLSPAQFLPVLEKLKPYIEQFRMWLPDLAENLDGRIAIFAGPVDYLRAALLVAGDNLDNVAGMYLGHGIKGGPTVMASRAFGEEELLRTLVHELWHLALASTGVERDVPRWLNEGMAVFLSAGEAREGVMRYEVVPSELAGFIDAPPTAEQLRRALNAGPAEFYLPANLRENYAAGWAVAMYFARASVTRLRAMLRGNADELKAAAADIEKLHRAVSAVVKSVLGEQQ